MNARSFIPFFLVIPVVFFSWHVSAILSSIMLSSVSTSSVYDVFITQTITFFVLTFALIFLIIRYFGGK